MSTEARIAALERALGDLRRELEPQALRAVLERTWNPRGLADELLVQDATGAPLERRRTVQFLGDVADDPANKRTVVAGSAGLEGVHSDAFVPDDASRLKFTVPGSPTVVRSALTARSDNAFFGDKYRILELAVSDTNPYSDPRARLTLSDAATVADPGLSTTAVLRASRGGLAGVTAADTASGPALSRVTVEARRGTGTSVAKQACEAGGVSASLDLSADDGGSGAALVALIDGYRAVILQSADNRSEFVRAAKVSGANVTRFMRGPFAAIPGGAIAAGGSTTVTVSNALFGTTSNDNAVSGALEGAAGSELVLWSWTAGPGANQITVSFTNTDAIAHTVAVRFVTVCDA